jgi:hypothetical protein
MSAMLQNLSKMMHGNQDVPDNIKNILNTMNSNNNKTHADETNEVNTANTDNSANTTNANQNTSSNTRENSDLNTSNPFENFDINTFLKMQQIVASMNDNKNDSRTNLLMSLKPYLKESRKNKVDQYIQLMKIGKIFEIMNPLGGDNTHVQ